MVAVVRCAAPSVALASVALVLSTPMVWRWAFAQSADVPLAYLTFAAAAGLTDLVFGSHQGQQKIGGTGGKGRTVPPWLTGFFLGLMVWTKNEGMVFSLILIVVFAAGAWIRRRRVSDDA